MEHVKLFLILVIVFAVAATGYAFFGRGTDEAVFCTEEAMLCPDGSAVGRTGPSCEFAPCPEVTFRFGYVRAIGSEEGATFIEIDEVEWLNGEAAILAAVADSGCAREAIEVCAPSLNNGFYIKNSDETTARYILSPGAIVKIRPNPGAPDQLLVSENELKLGYQNPALMMDLFPFAFFVSDGALTYLAEEYLP